MSYTGPPVASFNLSAIQVESAGEPNGVGQLGQPFTVNVKYTSATGKVPTVANAVIDSTPYPMTYVKGSPTTGMTYQYTTSWLSQGDHLFQFQFNDGTGLQLFQEYTFSISSIVMRNSAVSPTSGTTTTPFTFSTVYHGPSLPTQADVVVDGTAYPLTYVSGDPAAGATYSATMTLAAGKHDFAFYATDGTDAWSDPQTPAVYRGLTVTAAGHPLIRSTIVAPRTAGTADTYDPS